MKTNCGQQPKRISRTAKWGWICLLLGCSVLPLGLGCAVGLASSCLILASLVLSCIALSRGEIAMGVGLLVAILVIPWIAATVGNAIVGRIALWIWGS